MTNLTGSNLNRREATGPKGEGRDSPSTFPKYPEYKDSGVEWLGAVPAHWDVKPLKRLAEVDNSGSYGVDPEEGGITLPVATTAQIDAEGRFDVSRMPERGFTSNDVKRYGCNPGDVLIVKSSGSAENIISGKAGLVREDTPKFVFSNFLMRLRVATGICTPKFLFSLVTSHLTRERIKQMCSTTTYPNLQVGLYSSAKLPCPPAEEQEKIENFLDHETARIDALVEQQQRLIELLKEKRQAVISHAVTKGLDPDVPMKDSGVEWLGEVPAHWDVLRLKNISPEITVGIVVEPSKYYVDDGVPALRSLNVRPGRISTEQMVYISPEANEVLSKSKVRTGDLVAVRSGQPGTTAVVPSELDGCNCIDLIIIRKPSVACEKFLCWFFASDCAVRQFSEGSGGAIQQHFNISTAANIVVPAPSRPEQVRIAEYIDNETSRIDELIATAESTSQLLSERRSALISAAVTGKIDVRDWQPPAGSAAFATATQTEMV